MRLLWNQVLTYLGTAYNIYFLVLPFMPKLRKFIKTEKQVVGLSLELLILEEKEKAKIESNHENRFL